MADDIKAIVEKLDILTRIVAIRFLEGKAQREQIWLLSKAGFQPREIADLIGTTSNTVSVNLTAIRKAGKKYGQKSRKKGKKNE